MHGNGKHQVQGNNILRRQQGNEIREGHAKGYTLFNMLTFSTTEAMINIYIL
jgi:hypothetical protein